MKILKNGKGREILTPKTKIIIADMTLFNKSSATYKLVQSYQTTDCGYYSIDLPATKEFGH